MDFSVPPYVLNDSIVGQKGWEHFGMPHAAESASRIVEVPWNPQESALALQTTDRSEGRIRIQNTSISPSDFSEKVSVTTSMAFDFTPAQHRGGVTVIAFANIHAGHAPLVIGMDYSAEGGLFYRGNPDTGNVLILSKEDIKMHAFYEIHLEIDAALKSFDIRVIGQTFDDAPFQYSASEVEAGNGEFSGIFLESLEDERFLTYVGKSVITSPVEPGKN